MAHTKKSSGFTQLYTDKTHKICALIYCLKIGQNFTPYIVGSHVLGFDYIQNGLRKKLRVFHVSSFLTYLIRKIISEILHH
jgi:hypothetical protein